jgi:hypothetical protein
MSNPEAISVGGVAILYSRFSDWNYPQFGKLVKILSDGSSIDNETLQTGAVPRLQATLSGWLQESSDVDTLNGYTASKEIVTVDDDGATRDVVVLDFSTDRVIPGLWSCSLTLVDFGATGS